MKKFRTVLCMLLVALCACIAGGCSDSCMGIDTYDVEMRVSNTLGENFYFYLGVDEIERTYEYTGEEIGFGLTGWRMPEHPKYNKVWLAPESHGPNVFISIWAFKDSNDETHTDIRTVKDRGLYVITYLTDTTSDMWFYRSVILRITVV